MKNKLRKVINKFLHKIPIFFSYIIIFIQEQFGLTNWYHPHPFKLPSNKVEHRTSKDRFSAIQGHLPKDGFTMLDIGCQEGYFLFRLSEHKGLKLGIDMDDNALNYARTLARKHKKNNVLLANYHITKPSDLDGLPDFDVVICMSIFHHWVKHYGEKEALQILDKVAEKTKKLLVFDTGEPTEITQKWASDMAFISPTTDEYFSDYFMKSGFANITNVGKFDTNLSLVKRNLYVAAKD